MILCNALNTLMFLHLLIKCEKIGFKNATNEELTTLRIGMLENIHEAKLLQPITAYVDSGDILT